LCLDEIIDQVQIQERCSKCYLRKVSYVPRPRSSPESCTRLQKSRTICGPRGRNLVKHCGTFGEPRKRYWKYVTADRGSCAAGNARFRIWRIRRAENTDAGGGEKRHLPWAHRSAGIKWKLGFGRHTIFFRPSWHGRYTGRTFQISWVWTKLPP
jgi:hypothetical protein